MNNLNVGLMFTGGIDSTVAATLLVRSGIKPHLFQVDEGLPQHVRAGKKVAESLGLEEFHHIISVPHIFPELRGKINEPTAHEYECGHFMIILSLVLAYAEKYGIQVLGTGSEFSVFGNPEDDVAVTSLIEGLGNVQDTSNHFRRKIADLYNETYRTQIVWSDPFMHMTKTDVVRLGAQLGAPFEHTCTCRQQINEDGDYDMVHCGRPTCRTCNERKSVFILAEVEDPTFYVVQDPPPAEYLDAARKCRASR